MQGNQKIYPFMSSGVVSVPNPFLNGTGTLVSIVTGNGDGAVVKSITIQATGTTTQGMVRLFTKKFNGITTLWREVMVSASTQGVIPAFVDVINGITLGPNDEILASTQNAETFNIIASGVYWTNCACPE